MGAGTLRAVGERSVVLVHGAWHGAWCWEAVLEGLAAAGVRAAAADLPSVTRGSVEVADDADHVRGVIESVGGPVVLIGHSYGGAVVTDAGTHPAVEHVVYIAAFALAEGESVTANGLTGGEEMDLGDALRFDGDVVHVDPKRATELFYHDCPPAVAAVAVARLRPQSIAAMTSCPRSIAWRTKPSTYALCTDDRVVPVTLQRSSAARVPEVVEWPTSHSPFLSRPELVVDLCRDLAQ